MAREVRDDRFGTLRQDQRDTIAAPDACTRQRIRQPIRLLLQVPERQRCACPVLVLPVQREARPVGRPATAAGFGKIEVGRNVPAMRGADLRITVDGGHSARACSRSWQ